MSYRVELSEHFKKEAKRLAKKYDSLTQELAILFDELSETPIIGTSLGKNVYKIRLGIASKRKGKRGGGRVITYVRLDEEAVVLLSIYNKGEKDSISEDEILKLIEKFLAE